MTRYSTIFLACVLLLGASEGWGATRKAKPKKGKRPAAVQQTAPAEATPAAATEATPAEAAPAESATPAAISPAAEPVAAEPAATPAATDAAATGTAVEGASSGAATTTESISAAPAPEVPAPQVTDAGATVYAADSRPTSLGLGIAPKLGLIVPTSDLGPTYMAGLDVSYRLPALAEFLGVALDFGFAQPPVDGSISDASLGDVSYALDQRLITLAVEAFATAPVGPVSLYGGAAYGVYVLRAKVDALEQTNTESQVRSGAQLRGGVGYRAGPGDVFGELRYHYVGLDFLSTGKANAGGITTAVGYRFQL